MPPQTKKILIVDDEEDFVKLLKTSLEMRGLGVIAATNAVEAGMRLADTLPDLILMDLRMPGINGFQACEAIKRNPRTKDVPIIIISAVSDESEIKRAHKIGVVEYFVKPVTIERLIEKVKEVLGVEQKKDTKNINS